MKLVSLEWQYKFTIQSEKIILPDLEAIIQKGQWFYNTKDQSIQAQVSFPSLFITEIIMHTVLMNNEQFVYSTISSITNDELLS